VQPSVSVAASRFSSLSGAFACDSKKAFIPVGYWLTGIFFATAATLRAARHTLGNRYT